MMEHKRKCPACLGTGTKGKFSHAENAIVVVSCARCGGKGYESEAKPANEFDVDRKQI